MATLVYHNGALGDFLTILPALSHYRHISNENSIILLGKKKFGMFAKQYHYIDDVIDVESSRTSYLFKDTYNNEIQGFFKSFSNALIFTQNDSPILLHAKKQIHLKIFHHNPIPSTIIHIVDYHLSLINYSKDLDKSCIMHFQDCYDYSYSNLFINYKFPAVAIAPGSGSCLKNWPLKQYQIIASLLEKNGMNVYWITGESEENFRFNFNDNIIKNADLSELVVFFKKCDLYIGNDSGITHLAAASGCPVIALFGPSNPSIWAPRGLSVKIIFKNICKPCHNTKMIIKECERQCINSIETKDVIELISKIGIQLQ